MKKLGVRTIVAIGVGAAIFFVLGRFAAIPVFANTSIMLQYAVLGFFAVVFGPVAGLFIGLIGHALIDFTSYGPWWSWIIASGVVGLLIGLGCMGIDLDSGEWSAKTAVRFCVVSVIANLIAWVGVAPVLDILIYSEPVEKIFVQGLIAATSNAVITCVLGTLLLFAYSKTRTKQGSLDKE